MSAERTVERRIPRDAAVVINILRSMGVKEWEPRVVNQPWSSSIVRPRPPPRVRFLGIFLHPPRARPRDPHPARARSLTPPTVPVLPPDAGYTSEVLEESQVYAEHAGRETVELDDVKLAVEAKLQTEFTRPAGTEEMHEYAASVNRAPMPPLTNRPGIHMPQDDNLPSANYQFFPRGYHAAEDRRERVDKPVDGGVGGAAGAGAGAGAAVEPTAMEAHDSLGFRVGGGKGTKR